MSMSHWNNGSPSDVSHALAGLSAFGVVWTGEVGVDGVWASFRPGVGPTAYFAGMHVELVHVWGLVRGHGVSFPRVWLFAFVVLYGLPHVRTPHACLLVVRSLRSALDNAS